MNSLKIITIGLLVCIGLHLNAQTENSKSEIEQITKTLMDYIDGTANGEPNKLRQAFHSQMVVASLTNGRSVSLRPFK